MPLSGDRGGRRRSSGAHRPCRHRGGLLRAAVLVAVVATAVMFFDWEASLAYPTLWLTGIALSIVYVLIARRTHTLVTTDEALIVGVTEGDDPVRPGPDWSPRSAWSSTDGPLASPSWGMQSNKVPNPVRQSGRTLVRRIDRCRTPC